MQGVVFDIKRFSVNDGPGIRTTLFLKGCYLTCPWCHNPESVKMEPETIQVEEILDGQPYQVSKTIGMYWDVTHLTIELDKDRHFWEESLGGVTFSGGEPLFQLDFLLEMLKILKKKRTHSAVDTSGCASAEDYSKILPYTDLFLYDLKLMDHEQHKQLTGKSNSKIMSNLDFLLSNHKKVWLRLPLIPGYNDSASQVDQLIDFIRVRKDSIDRIDLLPFHRSGFHKYTRLATDNLLSSISPPTEQQINAIIAKFASSGLSLHVGG